MNLDINALCNGKKAPGGGSGDIAQSIEQTSDGGHIVGGNSSSNDGDISDNYGSYDYWIVKLESSGTIQWQKPGWE